MKINARIPSSSNDDHRPAIKFKHTVWGINEWWQDFCKVHGKASFSSAWGGGCVECAKAKRRHLI